MPIYNSYFTVGAGPQATFYWVATESQDTDGNWYVQLVCNYGSGANTNDSSQTDPIPWGDNQTYAVYANQNDPAITVTGTMLVNFGPTGGDDFTALFTGDMTLTGTNQISAYNMVVASAVVGG